MEPPQTPGQYLGPRNCKYCKQDFRTFGEFIEHASRRHAVASFCNRCNKNVEPGDDVGRSHAVTHSPHAEVCSCCRFVWRNKWCISRHKHVESWVNPELPIVRTVFAADPRASAVGPVPPKVYKQNFMKVGGLVKGSQAAVQELPPVALPFPSAPVLPPMQMMPPLLPPIAPLLPPIAPLLPPIAPLLPPLNLFETRNLLMCNQWMKSGLAIPPPPPASPPPPPPSTFSIAESFRGTFSRLTIRDSNNTNIYGNAINK